MLCDRCGEREATNHEVIITNGVASETHLCEACAADAGLGAGPGHSVEHMLPDMMELDLGSAEAPAPDEPDRTEGARQRAATCPGCGLTFAEFKRTGLVGCERCYEAFEDRLSPLLERAHEGGAHHVGKIPKRALAASRSGDEANRLSAFLGDQKARAERLSGLRRQLEQAVAAEQYERAASLRDEIRRTTTIDPSAGLPDAGLPGTGPSEGSPS